APVTDSARSVGIAHAPQPGSVAASFFHGQKGGPARDEKGVAKLVEILAHTSINASTRSGFEKK
ncbi:unnamed protein product, partial [Sphacelaria rigidula]